MTKRVTTEPGPAPVSDTEPSGAPVAVGASRAAGAAGERDALLDAMGGRPRVFVDERRESAGASGAAYYAEAHPVLPGKDAATLPDAKIILDVTPAPGTGTEPLAPRLVVPDVAPTLFDGATTPPRGEVRTRRESARRYWVFAIAACALSVFGVLGAAAVRYSRPVAAVPSGTSAPPATIPSDTAAPRPSAAATGSAIPTTSSSSSAGRPSSSVPAAPLAPSARGSTTAAASPTPVPSAAPSTTGNRAPAPALSSSGGILWNFDTP